MAGYNISINSKFNPFSYQELLAPVMAETQAHKTTEEAYGALDAEAAQWENLLDPVRDKDLYDQYKNYRQGIANMVDKLNTEGYYQNAYKDALAKRSQYVQDIMPIKSAYDRWQSDIKTQAEARAKDPTRIFDLDADSLSTSDYYKNRGLNASTAQASGEVLRKQVLETAQQYARVLTKTGSLEPLGIPFQYTKQFRNGATEKEVMDAILNNPNAKPILNNIVKSVLSGSGIDQWNSVVNNGGEQSAKYQQAYALASQGLYGALGTTTHENLKDTYNEQLYLMRNKKAMDTPPAESSFKVNLFDWADPEGSETVTNSKNTLKEAKKIFDRYKNRLTGSNNVFDLMREDFENNIQPESLGITSVWNKKLQDSILLNPRQYFNADDPEEKNIIDKIEKNVKVGKDGTAIHSGTTLSDMYEYLQTHEKGRQIAYDIKKNEHMSQQGKPFYDLYNSLGVESLPVNSYEALEKAVNDRIQYISPRGTRAVAAVDASLAKSTSPSITQTFKKGSSEDSKYKDATFYSVDDNGRVGEAIKGENVSEETQGHYLTNFEFKGGTDSFDLTKADAKKRDIGFYVNFHRDATSGKAEDDRTYFIPMSKFPAAQQEEANRLYNEAKHSIEVAKKANNWDVINAIINNYNRKMEAMITEWQTFANKRKGNDLGEESY